MGPTHNDERPHTIAIGGIKGIDLFGHFGSYREAAVWANRSLGIGCPHYWEVVPISPLSEIPDGPYDQFEPRLSAKEIAEMAQDEAGDAKIKDRGEPCIGYGEV